MAPVLHALLASLITWSATATGAASVFVLPRLPSRGIAVLLAVATVLMGWASVDGLLAPATALAGARFGLGAGLATVLVAAACGACGVRLIRRRLLAGIGHGPVMGRQMFLVMTLHHVPEGMAVGLSVAAATGGDAAAAAGAGALVLAMAVHNAAEGALVSLPLRQEGVRPGAAWMRGQLSGLAEIGGSLLGAGAVALSTAILPWALAAAGGAMVGVIAGDLLPGLIAAWRARRALAPAA